MNVTFRINVKCGPRTETEVNVETGKNTAVLMEFVEGGRMRVEDLRSFLEALVLDRMQEVVKKKVVPARGERGRRDGRWRGKELKDIPWNKS